MNLLRQPSLPSVKIILTNLFPPSVNNYVRHTRSGIHFKTTAARDFALTVSVLSKGSVDAEHLRLEVHLYFAKGQKGDGDNFFKCTADSLVQAGIIKSDAHITQWYLEKHRDINNPRTEIYVSAAT
jgi:crossover junction endodeoxyribonuclease RusA